MLGDGLRGRGQNRISRRLDRNSLTTNDDLREFARDQQRERNRDRGNNGIVQGDYYLAGGRTAERHDAHKHRDCDDRYD